MGMDGWSTRRWDAMADAMGAAVVPAMPDDVAAAMPVAPAVPAVKFRDSNWIRR